MVKMNIEYLGGLHCEATHGPSGTRLTTDAPKDNRGKGESFSPTDLFATSLASCITTIMGIAALDNGIELGGLKVDVEKEMAQAPMRRIARVGLVFHMPRAYGDEERVLLEAAARGCPVCRSISPELKVDLKFEYPA